MGSIAHIIAVATASAAETAKIQIHRFSFPSKINKLGCANPDSNGIFIKLAGSYILGIV
jgi:hypothetical protein